MATTKPNRITLRSYQVGFGDCFLMTFHYKKFDRHILIDFGSTGIPKTSESKKIGADKLMTRVAKISTSSVAESCMRSWQHTGTQITSVASQLTERVRQGQS